VTDFKQLCEGLETLAAEEEVENHLEGDHLEEVHLDGDQSSPLLPKA